MIIELYFIKFEFYSPPTSFNEQFGSQKPQKKKRLLKSFEYAVADVAFIYWL